MNDSKQHVHIGARQLDPENVKRMLPNIINLERIIDTFRENASYHYEESRLDSYELPIKEQYDNVISILGNRGTGKTSAMLTIISEIKKGTFFKDKELNKNNYDLFSDLIAPEDMSDNSNILGWIIVVLEKFYLEMKEIISKKYISIPQQDQKEIERLFIEIKSAYQYRKPESNQIITDNFSNMDDFARTKIIIEENDMQLIPLFFNIINRLVDTKWKINQYMGVGDNKIPLIFFCFDDVDVDTNHSVSILRDIITFLSHPNIVVLVSGDYKIFSQTATINMLDAEKIHYNELNQCYIYGTDEKLKDNTALELAKSRSEFLLRKVLPPLYRFELRPLDNEDKSYISYAGNANVTPNMNKRLEQFSIVDLISELYDMYPITQDNYENNFLYISKEPFVSSRIWSMKVGNDKSSDAKTLNGSIDKYQNKISHDIYVVYPYLSIFSSSIPGIYECL